MLPIALTLGYILDPFDLLLFLFETHLATVVAWPRPPGPPALAS